MIYNCVGAYLLTDPQGEEESSDFYKYSRDIINSRG